MAEITKERTQEIIDKVLAGLEPDVFEKRFGYYMEIYPEGTDEWELANAATLYPELRPQIAKVAEKVAERIENRNAYSIWVNDEVQAGSPITYALAMNDKQYCALFARVLGSQDLNHEVDQNNDIKSLISKWGICPETILILEARANNPGQWAGELFDELAEEGLLEGTDFALPEEE